MARLIAATLVALAVLVGPAQAKDPLKLACTYRAGLDYEDAGAILTQLGFASDEITEHDDLADPTTFNGYHAIFLNDYDFWNNDYNDAQAIANLRNFVRTGGALYCSVETYKYIGEAFPGHVDHYPVPRVGKPQTVASQIVDPGMEQYHGGAPGNVDYDMYWSPIKRVAPSTRVYMTGTALLEYKHFDAGTEVKTGVPLCVSFRHGRGRVVLSTFHLNSGLTTAQEALERYLALICVNVREASAIDELLDGAFARKLAEYHTLLDTTTARDFTCQAPGGRGLVAAAGWTKGDATLALYAPGGALFDAKTGAAADGILSIEVPEDQATAGEWMARITPVDTTANAGVVAFGALRKSRIIHIRYKGDGAMTVTRAADGAGPADGGVINVTGGARSSVSIKTARKIPTKIKPNEVYLNGSYLDEVTANGPLKKIASTIPIDRVAVYGDLGSAATKGGWIRDLYGNTIGSVKYAANVNSSDPDAPKVAFVEIATQAVSDKPMKVALSGCVLSNLINTQPVKSLKTMSKKNRGDDRNRYVSYGGVLGGGVYGPIEKIKVIGGAVGAHYLGISGVKSISGKSGFMTLGKGKNKTFLPYPAHFDFDEINSTAKRFKFQTKGGFIKGNMIYCAGEVSAIKSKAQIYRKKGENWLLGGVVGDVHSMLRPESWQTDPGDQAPLHVVSGGGEVPDWYTVLDDDGLKKKAAPGDIKSISGDLGVWGVFLAKSDFSADLYVSSAASVRKFSALKKIKKPFEAFEPQFRWQTIRVDYFSDKEAKVVTGDLFDNSEWVPPGTINRP